MTNTETRSVAANRIAKSEYGSDLVVETLGALDVPFMPLNPGSSFRGIHDSLVNFGAAKVPEMIVCMHEEIAIAIAHGYGRVTDRPLAAAVHDVVGLQHASMAIYNAWCDRVPLIVIGGTGPVDSRHRRPHIDWVHTALIQGNQVRDYTKWDDQPASVEAIPDSLLKAYRIAMTEPKGPVYVCFDVDLQEQALASPLPLPDPARFRPPAPVAPDPDALGQAASLLAGAEWPVIVVDELRTPAAVEALRRLAETLSAPVVAVGPRFAVATHHPLNLSLAREDALAGADVVLALDVFDLDAAMAATTRGRGNRQLIAPTAQVVSIGVDDLLERAWASDRGPLFPVDLPIAANTGVALPLLVSAVRRAVEREAGRNGAIAERRGAVERMHATAREARDDAARRGWEGRPISLDRLYSETFEAIRSEPWSVVQSGYGRAWGGLWDITEREQLAGGGRGSGLGEGAGCPLGATLAHKGTGRLCVSIVGDGELLYTPSSLWTAANQSLPLLTIVNNNRSYGNDESHQDHVARVRSRPVENRGVGIYLDEPKTDFVALAKSFGVEAFGAVEDPNALRGIIERAATIVRRDQRPVLVEVITQRM